MSRNDRVGKLEIGNSAFDVFDDGVTPVFVDLFSECSVVNGVMRIGLVSVTADGDGAAVAHVVSRLRMNLATATDLRNALTNLLDGNAEAREKAN